MKYSLSLCLSLCMLAGCSSTPTRVESGSIKARTFNFISAKAKPYPGYVDKREPVHKMIQDAITKNMEARGVRRVDQGDITIAYLVVVGDNVSTTSINDYFGYGRNASEIHNKAQDAYTGSKNPNQFAAGTLLIDIIDNKNFELVKRNYASRPLFRDLPEDAKAARIQEVVDEILRDVRVGE